MLVIGVGLAACVAAPAEARPRPTPARLSPAVKRPDARARQAKPAVGNLLRRQKVRSVAGGAAALARGTAVDGPRHTGRAIRKNPRMFAAGVVLIGTIGAVTHKLGFNGEHVALALSGAAVAAQVRAAWPSLKRARGRELARRIGADVLWPVILFGASFGVGHTIHGEAPPGHSMGLRQLITSFLSSAVIGGDAPAVGVTALDTRRGGDGH
jgi:hypothetical protein